MEQLSTLTSLDTRAGEDISDTTSLPELLEKAQLNFDVEKTTLHTPEGDEVPGRFLLRRSDTNHTLGVVGNRYNPVDNYTMLEPFHQLVLDHGAQYESAGVIRGGKKCWVSATLPGQFHVPGRTNDIIEQRIVAFLAHDGLGRNSYFTLANRVVCNNQLRMLTDNAQRSKYGFNHTRNWENNFHAAAVGFEAAIKTRVQFEKTIVHLNKMKMNPDQVRSFSHRLYRIKNAEDMSTKAKNRTEQLVNIFKHGAGNCGSTRWDALNAVTELLDHHNTKNHKTQAHARIASQNRFVSNNINGYGDSIKQRAVRLLTDSEITFK